jgi:hypothetical protein
MSALLPSQFRTANNGQRITATSTATRKSVLSLFGKDRRVLLLDFGVPAFGVVRVSVLNLERLLGWLWPLPRRNTF